MRIDDLALLELSGEFEPDEMRSEERRVDPLDLYPEFVQPTPSSDARRTGPVRHRQVYLEVRTDEGATGLFGPVDGPHAPLLRRGLRDFVIGRDPMAVEQIWDLLYRRDRHARSGHWMMAMSALDCALWDLRGKVLGQPVYRLLGGPTRVPVPAYASMLGFSLETDALIARSQEYKAMGYGAQKWFFRHGPGQAGEGACDNMRVVKTLREAVGGDVSLMFDAFNSWDLPYALDMARRMAPYRPAWLEEPLPVDRLNAFRTLRERTDIPIATGEHLYTRWQVRDLLEAGACDVIQADPDWCGGISELVKIASLCSAYDVPLCPHGHSLHAALHVAAAVSPVVIPQVEFLILHQRHKQRFMRGYLEPESGVIAPPELPGLGIEIDPDKAQEIKEIDG